MNLPENITKKHLLKAISKIDKEGIPSDGKSQYYDVVLKNGNRYPPKLIVAYANLFANGRELDRSHFRGGLDTECFKLLEKNGFVIDLKGVNMEYHQELKQFLRQAKEENLKTKHFKNNYRGLNVKVSFGQGMPARIPWISFLIKPNSTANGIYPVYLFYKDLNLLILSYGISETTDPKYKWSSTDTGLKICDYFKKEVLGEPARYGDSLVYKAYNTKDLPSNKVLDGDLNTLIDYYKSIMDEYKMNATKTVVSQIAKKTKIDFEATAFNKILSIAGLYFNEKIVIRLLSSLITKPFVILSGLSGSGKTKLAQAFVKWICQDEEQYRIIPVGADWTNREPLLGYPNALKPEEYVKPDSGVLDLIILANNNSELPYFLILDEMNLSHVERYFADFLSAMESNESIPLYSEGQVTNGVPSALTIPKNLFIVGTVNIDETTNMFSPKVLDRANTIEFRVTEKDMEGFLSNIKEIDMKSLSTKGAGMAKSFLELSEKKSFPEKDNKKINKTLIRFFVELKKTGAEFGYRSATEILRLINQLNVLDDSLTLNQKLDIAIMQKLLPKLHGSRRKLCPILETLGSFCIDGEVRMVKDVFEMKDFNFESENVLYPLSLEKITRMYRGAIDNGFASFAEA